jgi:hypothetical protein
MITLLKDFLDNVLAAKADGHITCEDYDSVLVPAAKAAFASNEKLRVYYEIGKYFTGIDAGAMWEDFALGVGHLLRWKRMAVVTDEGWIKNAAAAFSIFMPCRVKIFPLAESAQARAWVSA